SSALALVKRSPVSCIPSPESPANRMMTRSMSTGTVRSAVSDTENPFVLVFLTPDGDGSVMVQRRNAFLESSTTPVGHDADVLSAARHAVRHAVRHAGIQPATSAINRRGPHRSGAARLRVVTAPTPAVAVLVEAGIAHRLIEYDHQPGATSFGDEAVESLGLDPARVYKTLVV